MANVNPTQIQEYLGGADYPCSRDELVDYARDNGASSNILQTIARLPDHEFNSPTDVSEAIGSME